MAEIKPTSIRMDEDLYAKVKADAEKERRSISQQINIIIQKHYDGYIGYSKRYYYGSCICNVC